ncbi:hypothetical protein BKA66DRAFT_445204 [Pyrenochaeta sp. MPI-SDFR-AT-0127]|nr:hypothetical protein BKA66DRAFT_445204 [Pyrenochaeta sp. MPI-SDFR-AT-0127]
METSMGRNPALENLIRTLGDRAVLLDLLPNDKVMIEDVPLQEFPAGEKNSCAPIRMCAGKINKTSCNVWIYVEETTRALIFQGFDFPGNSYGMFGPEHVVARANLLEPFEGATNGIKLLAMAYYYFIKRDTPSLRTFVFENFLRNALITVCEGLEQKSRKSLIVRLYVRCTNAGPGAFVTDDDGNDTTTEPADIGCLENQSVLLSDCSIASSPIGNDVSNFNVERYIALLHGESSLTEETDILTQSIDDIQSEISTLDNKLIATKANLADTVQKQLDLKQEKRALWECMDKHEIYEAGKRAPKNKRLKHS